MREHLSGWQCGLDCSHLSVLFDQLSARSGYRRPRGNGGTRSGTAETRNGLCYSFKIWIVWEKRNIVHLYFPVFLDAEIPQMFEIFSNGRQGQLYPAHASDIWVMYGARASTVVLVTLFFRNNSASAVAGFRRTTAIMQSHYFMMGIWVNIYLRCAVRLPWNNARMTICSHDGWPNTVDSRYNLQCDPV